MATEIKNRALYIQLINNLNGRNQAKLGVGKTILIVLATLAVLSVPVIISLLVNASNGLTIIISTVFFLGVIGIFLIRRECILRRFLAIPDAYKLFHSVDNIDANKIKELYNHGAIVIVGETDKNYLNFLYNWFRNTGMIANKAINLYKITGKQLHEAYPKSQTIDYETYSIIDPSELIMDEAKKKTLYTNTKYFNIHNLEQVVKID